MVQTKRHNEGVGAALDSRAECSEADQALIARCKSEGFDKSAARNLLRLIDRAGLKLNLKEAM